MSRTTCSGDRHPRLKLWKLTTWRLKYEINHVVKSGTKMFINGQQVITYNIARKFMPSSPRLFMMVIFFGGRLRTLPTPIHNSLSAWKNILPIPLYRLYGAIIPMKSLLLLQCRLRAQDTLYWDNRLQCNSNQKYWNPPSEQLDGLANLKQNQKIIWRRKKCTLWKKSKKDKSWFLKNAQGWIAKDNVVPLCDKPLQCE